MSAKSVSLTFEVTDEDDDLERPREFIANVDYLNTDYVYLAFNDQTVAMTVEDAIAMSEFFLSELGRT